jgi:uroporphyrinogen-III synthase
MSGPLSGRRVVVTRARAQARDFGEQLEALGAEVLYCPAIQIAEPADRTPFARAVADIATYEWLILTSANGVRVFFEELEVQGRTRLPASVQVACVGPATAAALRVHATEPSAIPEEFLGSALAGVLAGRLKPGTRVLLARGAGGNRELPEQLRKLGVDVTEVESYRSVPDLQSLGLLAQALKSGSVDLITFTSPSTVVYTIEGLGGLPGGVGLAAIGPVTEARMRELGLRAAVVAPEHSIPGLVAAITEYFAAHKRETGKS